METWYETGAEYVTELGGFGYNMTQKTGIFNIVTSVSNLRNVTEAVGDPRREGVATGRVVPLASLVTEEAEEVKRY